MENEYRYNDVISHMCVFIDGYTVITLSVIFALPVANEYSYNVISIICAYIGEGIML